MNVLEMTLRKVRDSGSKCLIGYVMGGIREDWTDLVQAMIDGGADAVEIGLPFSDPMLDGAVIQRASLAALQRGAQVERILDELPNVSVPLIAMTYSNHLVSRGVPNYLGAIAAAGISGSIVADLPFEESADYLAAAHTAGVAPVLMAAPSTSADTAQQIARASGGFVYSMGAMAPTGRHRTTDESGWEFAQRLRSADGLPVVIGFGIDSPERAARAARYSDGVVVASALMDPVLEGATAASIMGTVQDFRQRLDEAAIP
ncbi:tryptophan synthase subunit alpha [Rhodococcus sp. PvR099]|nr:tryptophan synthase subunit alpha [Rhodococcus sp. PvR099]MBP1162071.1 tryptophan synthase alpha chain [Rhodococcus sp. PvR099]